MHTKRNFKRSAFSLVEVVVAVGIFALAIVGVIGLLGPTTKSIGEVTDNDAATRVVGVIQSGLQQQGFTAVQSALDTGYVYYATHNGDKIGSNSDSQTTTPNSQRFFEFSLVRNTTLSPAASDTSAGYLAFTIVLRWPAHLQDAAGTVVPDASKSSMIVPAAITR